MPISHHQVEEGRMYLKRSYSVKLMRPLILVRKVDKIEGDPSRLINPVYVHWIDLDVDNLKPTGRTGKVKLTSFVDWADEEIDGPVSNR